MKEIFNYKKLMLLSCCATVSFISVAHANMSSVENQDVSFTFQPDFLPVSCNAESSEYQFIVKNNKGPVKLGNFHIIINSDSGEEADSFPNDPDLVTVKAGNFNSDDCIPGEILDAGASCEVTVIVDPLTLDCPPDGDFENLVRGEVNRSLVIDLNSPQVCLVGDIEFDVDVLGAAELFSLLAPSVFNSHDDGPDSILQNEPGNITVYQNVANTDDEGFLTSQIQFLDEDGDAQAYGPHDYITRVANENLEAAFTSLYNLKYGTGITCNSDTDLGGGDTIAGSTVMCFSQNVRWPVVLDETLYLTGSAESLFVFVIDFPFRDSDPNPEDNLFIISEGAQVVLQGDVDANNVYWIIKDGSVEQMPESNLIGNVLIQNGTFETEPPEFCIPACPGPVGSIEGRILVLNDNADIQVDETHTDFNFDSGIWLFGTIINEPPEDDDDNVTGRLI